MKRIFTSFAVILLAAVSSFAQVIEKQELDRNGNPTFVKFDTKFKSTAESDAVAVLTKVLNTTQNDEFRALRTEQDQIGFTHERFQQYYKGIKVEHGVYIVHKRNGNIESLSGEYKTIKDVSVTPSISEETALKKAINFVDAEKYMWEYDNTYYPEAELVVVKKDYKIHPKEANEMVLAYKFNIYAIYPLSRAYIYVDAQTGEIVHKNNIIKQAVASGTLATRYSGSKTSNTDSYNGAYRLRDYSRGNGIETYDMNMGINYSAAVDFVDSDNNWTSAEWDNSDKDNAAFDAQWGAQMTYDYFYQTYSRNSFDNNGAAIKSYVHFDLVEYGYPNNDNAFWDGQRMTYGDGTSLDPLTTLDIAAHEIGHAVCTYTADLTYSYESGALNEGYSDIWAASVEYFAAPEKNTWVLGEDLGVTVRSLENPNAASQPDTYQGTYWATGSSDNGGVHTNSGVINHWFYILSVGKSGTNDNGDSYSVTGIGIDKAAAIAYRTESQYLTSSSNYADCRTKTIQAAEDLYGTASNEVIQTTNAFYAVGVGSAYDGGTGDSYCASKGNDYSYEWIAGVTIGSFTNTSGANGYTDYTSQTITLNAGSTNSVSLVPGFAGTTYDEYWKIWIDLNGDNDFDDADELVFDAGSLSKVTVTGNLIVPNVSAIETRLRVSMKYNGAQTACETFSYGEVEDYTVNIVAGGGDTEAPTTPTGLSSSNITETSFTLSWNASSDNVGVTEYDVYQDAGLIGSVTSTSASITGLTASTTYAFYVTAKDAAGNESNPSSSLNVTTSGGSGCSGTISSFPYSESFESGLGIWTQDNTDDIDWTRDSGGTPSSSTGPSAASDGSYYMYVEASSPNYPSKTAVLNSICFDLTGESAANFSFDYHMYGADMGTLLLQAKPTGGSWTTIWSKSGDQGNSWLTASVNLSSYVGTEVSLRFYGTTGSSYRGDMTIDNLSLTTGAVAGCTDIILSITFDNYPEETSWTIKDNGGTTVASGGTYGSQTDGSTLTETICLEDGCYDFTINDTYGDGICCSYGNGSYSLMNGSEVIASGGSFGSSETTNFCLSGGTIISTYAMMTSIAFTQDDVKFEIFPNPVNELLNVQAKGLNESATIKIVDMRGAKLMELNGADALEGIDVSDLKSGMYILQLQTKKGKLQQELFIKN